jgi:hypothetical protein
MASEDLDLVAKLRRAREDVRELKEENAVLRAELEKVNMDRALLLELIPKVRRGYEA